MKVLVSTRETQGERKNDFCHVEENELVMFPFECDGEVVDGSCGCKRSVAGFISHKASTTFKVADIPMGEGEYFNLYVASMQSAGWIPKWIALSDEDKVGARRAVKELLLVAAQWKPGSILERRGSSINARWGGLAILT